METSPQDKYKAKKQCKSQRRKWNSKREYCKPMTKKRCEKKLSGKWDNVTKTCIGGHHKSRKAHNNPAPVPVPSPSLVADAQKNMNDVFSKTLATFNKKVDVVLANALSNADQPLGAVVTKYEKRIIYRFIYGE